MCVPLEMTVLPIRIASKVTDVFFLQSCEPMSQHVPERPDENNNIGSEEDLINSFVTAIQVAQSSCTHRCWF
jgi:hypothetical protein